ncbi:uncharacterized protein LOC120375641 [Mauremys reevesii]|uniref:uncharacterized protein LOC120375641 n=1 Tax=Mauremys reevesii TaxID=260615 RepID=UPI00193EE270|nr:uncharacterized protein LOC120375641 [Mauremys reevesii]XP_039352354.1 uncharacterized protein LOC120375641 [Mauremys reevesii]
MSAKEASKLETRQRELQLKEQELQIKFKEMELKEKAKEADHKRDMEAKEAEHMRQMQLKDREMESQREAHRQALELEKAKQHDPTNPTPLPSTDQPARKKFPAYRTGEDVEAFLENFERVCIGYSIPEAQYMVELRSQLCGELLLVATEMPRDKMNNYRLFLTKARYRMGITPDHARQRFRAQKWKPEVSFPKHASYLEKHYFSWLSGANVKSMDDLNLLIMMEQFLDGVPEDITRYIQDGKPKNLTEAGEIGAKWMAVAENKKATVKGSEFHRVHTDTKPYHQGPIKPTPTTQGQPQPTSSSTSPVSSNPHLPSDPSTGRCFKCNELGHIKAKCPKNLNRVQILAPSHRRNPDLDVSQIPLHRRETLRVDRKEVIAWRDTGARVSYPPSLRGPQIHQPGSQSDNPPLHIKICKLTYSGIACPVQGLVRKVDFCCL